MSEIDDIRWQQRLYNFRRAVELLDHQATKARAPAATETESIALIKCFEMAHELAWNLLKDYLTAEGASGLGGSRSVTRLAIERGLLPAGTVWPEMVDCRNLTVHAYDELQAAQIARQILDDFVGELAGLRDRMTRLAEGAQP